MNRMKWTRKWLTEAALIVSDCQLLKYFLFCFLLIEKYHYGCKISCMYAFLSLFPVPSATKTDLSVLLECLKCQMKCPNLQKQALLTIYLICEKRGTVELLHQDHLFEELFVYLIYLFIGQLWLKKIFE